MKNVPAKPRAGLCRPATRRLLATSLVVGLSATPAAADNFIWNSSTGNTNWFNPQNWDNQGQNQVPGGGAENFALILNGQTAVIDDINNNQVGDLQGIIVGGSALSPSTLTHLGGTTQPAGGFPGFLRVGSNSNHGAYEMFGSAIQNKPLMEIGTADSDSLPGGAGVLTMADNTKFVGDQFAIGLRGFSQNRSFGDVSLTDKAEFSTTDWVHFENGTMLMTDDSFGSVGSDLLVGNRLGGDATLDLKRNSIVEVAGDLLVGRNGATGEINLSGNARLSMLGGNGTQIRLGTFGSGNGTINISDNAVLDSSTNLVLGQDQGIDGVVNQTAGTVVLKDNPDGAPGATDSLVIRGGVGSASLYHLDGGFLRTETIDARSGGFLFTDGRLAITERFIGALVQDGGTMAAGNSPGEVTYESDYTLNADATLEVEIQGTNNSDFDRYLIVGDVNLNNPTLDVLLLDNFNPMPGSTFDFMDWGGTLSGTFGAFNMPELDTGVKWNLDQVHDKGQLGVVWAADLDGDGDVDDADFGLLFAEFTGPNNGPPGNPDADLDGDGDVDDADFGVAFATFTGPGAAVVPEPASLALMMSGALFAIRRRR